MVNVVTYPLGNMQSPKLIQAVPSIDTDPVPGKT